MTIGYLAFGSNLYRPDLHILNAAAEVAALAETELQELSPMFRSKPLMDPDANQIEPQPDYCNAVASIRTGLSAAVLMRQLHGIESAHGRQRLKRWDARTLDIDLLLLGDLCLEGGAVALPHPGLLERDFVLYPMSQLWPDLLLPTGQMLREAAKRVGVLPQW